MWECPNALCTISSIVDQAKSVRSTARATTIVCGQSFLKNNSSASLLYVARQLLVNKAFVSFLIIQMHYGAVRCGVWVLDMTAGVGFPEDYAGVGMCGRM